MSDYSNVEQFNSHVIGTRTQHTECSTRIDQVLHEDDNISANQLVSRQKPQYSGSLYSTTIPWYTKLDHKSDDVITDQSTQHESSKPSETTESVVAKPRDGETCELKAAILAAINQGKEAGRRRRRVIQQRYRQRINDRATSLAVDTAKLKGEIQQLTVQHQVLLTRVPLSTTPWSVVVAYYDLFRNGLKLPRHLQGTLSTSDSNDVYKNFLHAVMAPEVSVNTGFGVDAALEDWKLLCRNIEDLDIQIVRLEYEEHDSLVVYVRGTATITEAMLRNEFSHLIPDLTRQKWSSIASKLVGQQLEVFTTKRFVWDTANSRIVSAHYAEDLVTPLQKLLGNLSDVAYMLRMPLNAQGTTRWGRSFHSMNH
ncbi:hypothetical protein PHMEG_00014184 [Phytophthora megakarya]|uniref:Bzip transcription factor n=1 Tax=Phytophthora megakarya TaxID=4795 RepID=A0A225W4J7_9STRA|nr:hypothetical protein PHMEG_00014184 [Phytophthora megakarya]